MNARLQQFLTMEGLTPARFAEIMGIQRSGISHLLAGRNKPSFEFIQKMMTSFPKLNPEWLILGKGKPYKESSESDSEYLPTDLPEFDLFTQIEPNPQITQKEADIETVKKITIAPEPSENLKFEQTPTAIRQKSISRITIFYSNGTYEER